MITVLDGEFVNSIKLDSEFDFGDSESFTIKAGKLRQWCGEVVCEGCVQH